MSVVAIKSYIQYRNNAYWIEGTRISLDSIVYAFRQGLLPESIVQSFPLLTLEQVYGAIAFYPGNRSDIDAYLAAEEAEFELILLCTISSLQPRKLDSRYEMNVCYQADADLNQTTVTRIVNIVNTDFEPIITKSLPSSAQTLASQVHN